MAFTFRQLRHGPDFSRARSDLVSIPAAVRRLVADCFRDHARDCAGWNWIWQSYGRRNFSLVRSIEPTLPVLLLAAAIFVLLSYLFFPGELIPAPIGVSTFAGGKSRFCVSH